MSQFNNLYSTIKQFKLHLFLFFNLLVLIALFWVRSYFTYDKLATEIGAMGVFFTVFGVVYAIITGFTLVEVLNRYGTLSHLIEDEVNVLEDIRDFLMYVDSNHGVKEKIKKALRDYVASVIDKEWKAMDSSKRTTSDTTPELYKLIGAVNKIKVNNESDRIALENIIGHIGELTTLRTKRITLSNESLPPLMKAITLFSSLIVVVGFLFLAISNLWLNIFVVLSISVVVSLLYFTIEDLNHPFLGAWNLSNIAYKELLKTLEE